MRWWRHSRLAHLVVMLLLLWTAVDLSHAGLCALESEGGAPIGAGPVSVAGTIFDGRTPQTPQSESAHVDDCFCCSHCVGVTAVLPPVGPMLVNSPQTTLVLSTPRIFGSPLDHPPQASLQ